jgi:type IV pilus assembly protein PilE
MQRSYNFLGKECPENKGTQGKQRPIPQVPVQAYATPQLGFTLLELLVVIAVIGILSAIAFPSYSNAMLKGKRAEGRTAILQLLQQQERYMTQQNVYAEYPMGSISGDGAAFKNYSGDSLQNANYLLTAEKCDSPDNTLQQCVRITATPQFSDADCGVLRMTSLGFKDTQSSSGATASAECWK